MAGEKHSKGKGKKQVQQQKQGQQQRQVQQQKPMRGFFASLRMTVWVMDGGFGAAIQHGV
jgi:hypothetical protein